MLQTSTRSADKPVMIAAPRPSGFTKVLRLTPRRGGRVRDLLLVLQINDGRGNGEGDRVLQSLAGVARATARTSDTVARLGGDEFVILMPETAAEADGAVATRLLEVVPTAVGRDGVPVTCSIGLASFRQAPASVELMLAKADELLYAAKADGRNTLRQAVFDAQAGLPDRAKVVPFPGTPPA